MSAPGRTESAAAALVLAVKDFKVAWSYRVTFIFGHVGVIGSIFLFYFVAQLVGESTEFAGPQDYFQFVIVGLAIGGLIERAVGASAGAARRDQVEGTLEAIASLPVSGATLGLGWLIYPLVDGLLGFVAILALALPLGLWGIEPDWVATCVSLTLIVVLFSALGLFGAALTLAFQQGAGAVAVVLAALALISGTLFPTTVMPEWLQLLAEFSPLKHALDAFRAAMLDGASLSESPEAILVLAIFTVVLLPLSVLAVELGLRRARRVGGLARF